MPVWVYALGLALVLAGVVCSFIIAEGGGAAAYLAGAGALVLVAAVPFFYIDVLKPIRKLRCEAGQFASACLDGGIWKGKQIDHVTKGLEDIRNELSESRFRIRELETTTNVFMAEKQQTEAVLKSLSVPVLVTDRFDDLIMANDVAGGLFGFDIESSRGKPISESLQFTELVKLIGETSERKVKVPKRVVELSYTGDDGVPIEVRVSLSSIIDPAGEILGVVTVVQDVTRDREVDRMKSEFVANVSHELKTPLTSIQAYVEMLVDGDAADEETRHSFYSIIETESSRMRSMIENLLNLSRLEAGVIQLNMEKVSLHKVIESVLEVMEPHAEKKEIKLEKDISPYLVPVMGDAGYLKRVFINLVSNAVKYTPEKGNVKVVARRDGETARVDIVDTGYGISEEDREKVFEKFYRVKGSSDKAKGTGLGLAMVKKIVEMHHGSIDVESEEEKGSKFQVALPGVS